MELMISRKALKSWEQEEPKENWFLKFDNFIVLLFLLFISDF